MSNTPADQACQKGANSISCAVLFMLISAVSLSINAVFIKTLTFSYSVTEITLVRFAIQFFIVVLVTPRPISQFLTIKRPCLHVFASILILCTTVLFSISITYIPMSSATAALFTAPLIVVTLAGGVLGETVGFYRWVAVAMGMVGAVIIIKPGFGSEHWAIFLAFISALTTALFHLVTRKLTRYDNPATSIAYISLACFLISSLSWSASWRVPSSVTDIICFLLLGITGWIGHNFLLKAMELAQASTLAPLNYVQLVSAAVLGYFFFSQMPDLWTIAGATIVAASGILCGSIKQVNS